MTTNQQIRYQGIHSPDELVSYQVAKSQTYALMKSEFTHILYKYSLTRLYSDDRTLDWLFECKDDPQLFGFVYNTYFNDRTRVPSSYRRSEFEAMLRGMSMGEFKAYQLNRVYVDNGVKCETPVQSFLRIVNANVFDLADLARRCEDHSSMECRRQSFALEIEEDDSATIEKWASNNPPEVVIYAPPHSGKTAALASFNAAFSPNCHHEELYDTKDIMAWNQCPSRVVTSVSSILKYGKVGIAFLPSEVEYDKRVLVLENPSFTPYSEVRRDCLTFARCVLTDEQIGSLFDMNVFRRPDYDVPPDLS